MKATAACDIVSWPVLHIHRSTSISRTPTIGAMRRQKYFQPLLYVTWVRARSGYPAPDSHRPPDTEAELYISECRGRGHLGSCPYQEFPTAGNLSCRGQMRPIKPIPANFCHQNSLTFQTFLQISIFSCTLLPRLYFAITSRILVGLFTVSH